MRVLCTMALLIVFSNFTFGKAIFEYKDIKGDDNGGGTYTYPTNKVFSPKAFDLIEFKIKENKIEYIFTFTIPINFKNDPDWRMKNGNGWDVQIFDVYLNFGKGKHKQTLAGRNVKIKEGWDKALVIAPVSNKIMWKREIVRKNDQVMDDESDFENLIGDVLLPSKFQLKRNTLSVSIEKNKLKNMKKLKGVQVFLAGAEGFPARENSYIRNVNEQNSEWRFGGGKDFYGDPNVIDVLGSNKNLSNYKSTEDEMIFPWINMLGVK